MNSLRSASVVLLATVSYVPVQSLGAQLPNASSIPIRTTAPATAVSLEKISGANGLQELANGDVLINDAGNRRVIVFDKDLATFRTVADSSTKTRNMYGKRATLIIPYTGDSTLLVDVGARAFLVMAPSGKVTRVMSPPRPNDLAFMASPGLGQPQFDAQGRVLYRTIILPAMKAPVPGKPFEPPVMPDSSPILRGDFNKRSADTVAWVRVPKMRLTVTPVAGGGVSLSPVVNPLANIDDWTVLPDGTVAVLRGQDYHIDWYSSDGARTSTPKMPFDWKRLSDDEKNAIVDSTKKAVAKLAPSAQTAVGAGHAGGGGGHGMTIMPIAPGDGTPPPQSTMGARAAIPAVPEVAPASDLPDYMPPVLRSGLMMSDPAGNVWILPSTSSQSGRGLLYDVINRKGEITQRVRLPEGRALAGFGTNGTVYLTSFTNGTAVLERTRIQ